MLKLTTKKYIIVITLCMAGSAFAKDIPVNPGASLQDAVDKAQAGDRVVLQGGTYQLEKTLLLTPKHSGIQIVAAKGETPVITSAAAITGWEKVTGDHPAEPAAANGHLWVASVRKGWRFHDLYINGKRQQVARTPNAPLAYSKTLPMVHGGLPQATPAGARVTFPAGMLKGVQANGDVEAEYYQAPFWNARPVLRDIQGDTAILASKNNCIIRKDFNGNVLLCNALRFLDEPGEWCVDSQAGLVYFWPPDGTMEGKTVTAPTLNELIRLQGDDLHADSNAWCVKYDADGKRVESATPPLNDAAPAAFTRLVRNVQLMGLTLSGTDRLPEDQWPEGWLRRNSENPDGVVYFQGAEECLVSECVIRDTGAYAVVLDHYAQGIAVLQNEMANLGSGGVAMSGYGPGLLDVNRFNIVDRNYIHDIGITYLHSAAVSVYGSGNNEITRNWIANAHYAAVAMVGADNDGNDLCDFRGRREGNYQKRKHEIPSPEGIASSVIAAKRYMHSDGNWVIRNIVDGYMTGLHDGGALYSWSHGAHTVWLENLLKRRSKERIAAWAGYMDDCSGASIMESNIAWADRHVNFRSMWRDNTHLNGSQSRSVKSLTQDTTPGPIPRAKSQVRWRFNHASFPAKPAGFDALLQVIENDAKAGGGWPPALTPAIIEQFQTKGP